MKRIYISIAAILLCGQMMAQTPANRTAQTIAADVLAQMPAQEQATYNKIINDLVTSGDEGVMTLIKMFNAPGKGSNSNVEYALSGLSNFVMAQGKEEARLAISKAYMKVLDAVTERETKAFVLRQLQIVGKDECVDKLAEFLGDRKLSGPAARALAANGSEKAGQILMAGLMQRMGTPETQMDVLEAIAEAQYTKAEELVKGFLANENPQIKKIAFYAISRIGSAASLKDLAEEAKAVNYTMEASGANEAYIALIKRVATQGDKESAEKAANDLMKKATKAGKTQSRAAALQILLSLKDKEDATKLIQKALKDKCKVYRNNALSFASNLADKDLYVELSKTLSKAKPEVQVDLLNWFGREAKKADQHATIANLEVRFDLPFSLLLQHLLKAEEYEVVEAATWTMVKMGNKDFIPAIANLLCSNDKQVVLLAQDALFAFSGDVDDAVANAIAEAGDDGKIAGLQVLANRKASSKINVVLTQTKSESAEVKAEAYKTLKDVVEENDITNMCGMLESAEASVVNAMQDAVISAISSLPAEKKVETITRRIYQAGNKKHLYYKVLASTGDKKALASIEEGFIQGTGEAKKAAFEAILNWNGLETADVLYNICKGGADDNTFDKALNRYVQVISSSSMTGENRLIFLRKAMEVAKTDAQRNTILQKIEGTGTFLAMLYAGEFLDDVPVQQAAANAVMNIALNHKEYTGDNVRALLEKVAKVLNNPDAQYQRKSITKHLDEMPAGTGFVSIFNGKDLSGWKGLVENPIARAKMSSSKLAKAQKVADEQMMKDWKVENGCLVYVGTGFDNLCTQKQYGDFEMYVDWMLDPAGPEADAGIYLRGTPQVQIWDIARVNVGAQVGSGGLYNNQNTISKPTKVADNKLGEWNSFYIKMVGERVTVYLNGEKVVDDIILENYWDRKLPIFPIEQIELQAHGSKCSFRNIYIKELERKEPYKLSKEEEKEGFKLLFDGTNMQHWTGNTVNYTIIDDAIAMIPDKPFGGNLYTKEEFANFVYRFEFQLTPGANNGIGLRTPMEGDAAYVGMESQILDCEHPIYKNITKLQHHGSIYGIIPAKPDHHKAFKPAGEWNEEEIVCDGDNMRVTVNGVVIVEGNIRDAVKNGTPDGKEHPGLFNKKGHIGFLGHGSPVKFRHMRIKVLK